MALKEACFLKVSLSSELTVPISFFNLSKYPWPASSSAFASSSVISPASNLALTSVLNWLAFSLYCLFNSSYEVSEKYCAKISFPANKNSATVPLEPIKSGSFIVKSNALFIPLKAFALIEVDITRGNLNPLPIAVSPLSIDEHSRKNF